MNAAADPAPAVDRVVGRSSWRERGVMSGHPPVVFLHGLGGTRGSWDPQLADLGDDRRCLAWDMPGYGDAALEEPLTFAAIANRVVELLDDAGIDEPVDLVGLSFGGQHALHTAVRAPERVRRLVLVSTSAVFGGDGTDADEWRAARLAGLDAIPPGSERMRHLAPLILDGIAGRPIEPTIRSGLLDAFARIPEAGLRAAIECLPTHDVTADLATIGAPTLVLVGSLDTETPPSYGQRLAEAIPHGHLAEIAGAGHLLPSEAPTPFNALVRDFLDADLGD